MKKYLRYLTIVLYFVAPVCFAQPYTIKVGSSPNNEDGDSPRESWNKQNSNNMAFAFSSPNTPSQFGVIGNGVADDTTAFQSMLNKAGEIFLPPGNYSVGNLFVTNNTHIRGGFNARLVFNASVTNWLMSVGNNTNVQIEGVIFDGGDRVKPGAFGTRNGLKMNLGTNGNSWVSRCEFIGLNGYAMQATEPGGVSAGQNYAVGFVEHCKAEFCGVAFYLPEIGSDSAEYSQWSHNEAVACMLGVYEMAGNTKQDDWRISLCDTGIQLVPGVNGVHGCWNAPTVNHCTVAVTATNVNVGEQFNGGIFIAGGQINLVACNGIEFSGCQFSPSPGPFIITNSLAGMANLFTGCKFQGDWQLVKQTIFNDGGAIFFGNWCWNTGGVTNSSDGSFANGSTVIKPYTYPMATVFPEGSAAYSGTTAQAPSPYFDHDTLFSVAANSQGGGMTARGVITAPSTNSVMTMTFLSTNTLGVITVTNFTQIIEYGQQAGGRRTVSSVIYPTFTLSAGYTDVTWTNSYTNSLIRYVGAVFGQGTSNSTIWVTALKEQPIQ
jgi:hypothetical protein